MVVLSTDTKVLKMVMYFMQFLKKILLKDPVELYIGMEKMVKSSIPPSQATKHLEMPLQVTHSETLQPVVTVVQLFGLDLKVQ